VRISRQTTRVIRVAFITTALLLAGGSLAHIKNEATQFPDIEFSAARFDIVVLVGAGIIPETPVFEPDKKLSIRELATWVALAEGLGRGGENPDTTALAAAALEGGFVASLEGDATLADLDRLFFDGGLAVPDPERSPTKAEAAGLIAAALDTDAGLGLLEKKKLTIGATGEVTEIAIEEGHHGNAYVLTIGGTKLEMDAHGRVANGPTDLLQWEGRTVRRSFVRGSGHHANWMYLEAAPREAPTPAAGSSSATPATADDAALPAVVAESPPEPPPPDRSVLYWLLAIVAILAVVLFFRSRRS